MVRSPADLSDASVFGPTPRQAPDRQRIEEGHEVLREHLQLPVRLRQVGGDLRRRT